MSITADRIARKARGTVGEVKLLDTDAKSSLPALLGGVLDALATGVLIVADQGRILHANEAAQEMLAARSPILALGGCLCALQPDMTKELRRAIAAVRAGGAGVGVPLIDKAMGAAIAHVLPLPCTARDFSQPVAIFVTPGCPALPIELGSVARLFRLTPAEARLLQHLVAGASLVEAAAALDIAEATARTHRNHIFIKTGVCRRSELLALVGRLVPPLRRPH